MIDSNRGLFCGSAVLGRVRAAVMPPLHALDYGPPARRAIPGQRPAAAAR
jgi:hypothetical protein